MTFMRASGRIVCFFRVREGKWIQYLPPSHTKTTPPFPETVGGVIHSSSCNFFSNCVTSSVQRPALSGVSQGQLKKTAGGNVFFLYEQISWGDVIRKILVMLTLESFLINSVVIISLVLSMQRQNFDTTTVASSSRKTCCSSMTNFELQYSNLIVAKFLMPLSPRSKQPDNQPVDWLSYTQHGQPSGKFQGSNKWFVLYPQPTIQYPVSRSPCSSSLTLCVSPLAAVTPCAVFF